MAQIDHILITQDTSKHSPPQTHTHIPSTTSLSLEPSHKDENCQQQHNSTAKVYLKCLIIALGGVFSGYNFGVLNLAQPRLNYVYEITENKELYEGLLSSSVLLGQMIGSIFCGSIIQKLGERKTCLLCDFFGILLTFLFVIPDFYIALIVRTVIGIIGGISDPTIVMYIKSISPKSLSGKTGSFYMLLVTCGLLISCLSGLGFPISEEDLQQDNDFYWRFHYILPAVFLAIRFFCLEFIYKKDTPFSLLKKNKAEESLQALREIYKEEHVLFEFEALKYQHEQEQKQHNDTWKNVFSKQNSLRQRLASALEFAYNFSGMIAILLFSSIIFEEFTGSVLISQYLTTGLMFLQIVSSFLSGELSKKFGRRTILICGMLVNIFLLVTFGTTTLLTKSQIEQESASTFTIIWTISIIYLFCSLFRMTTGTLVWSYVAEITSPKGNVLSVSLNFFLSFALGLVFPFLQKYLGLHIILYIFAGTQTVLLIYMYPKIKETKNLSQAQIDALFEVKEEKKEPLKIVLQLSHQQHSPKEQSDAIASKKEVNYDLLHNYLDQQNIIIEIKSDHEAEQFVPLVLDSLNKYNIQNKLPCPQSQR